MPAESIIAERVRHVLEGRRERLHWLNGKPWELGVPLAVPEVAGIEFEKRIAEFMDREMERWVEELKRKG